MSIAPAVNPQRKNSLSDACRAVRAAVKSRYPGLEICFVTLKDPVLSAETIAQALSEGTDPPMLQQVTRYIAGRIAPAGVCAQGLIFERGTGGTRGRILAPITVVRPPYYMTETLLFELYGAVWHVINRLDTVHSADGHLLVDNDYLAPDLAPTALIRHTLKADMFASLLLHCWHECPDSDRFVRTRALDALQMKERHRPEEYPSFLGIDALKHIMESARRPASLQSAMEWAQRMADDINLVITDDALAVWVGFATSAQDMAWRGFEPNSIARAAMTASTDPHIRVLAFHLAERLSLSPDQGDEVPDQANAFMVARQEENAHLDQMRIVFEQALDHVLQSGNSDAFYEKSAEQNYALLTGSVFGWCAYALQCAARAYDTALHRGRPPVLAARLEFEAICKQTDWRTLKRLGDLIVEAIRMRVPMDLKSIALFCQTASDMDAVVQSADITLNEQRYKPGSLLGSDEDQKMMAPGMRAFRGTGSDDYPLRAAMSLAGFDQNRRARA